jgi:hypothetical protein
MSPREHRAIVQAVWGFCSTPLFVMPGCLVSVKVMHRVSVEFYAVVPRPLTASWEPSTIAVAIVEMMVYMTVKMLRAVEPWSDSDEYAV